MSQTGTTQTDRLCTGERNVMLERMRAPMGFILKVVSILAMSFTAHGSSVESPHQKDQVNYDDPNLVFTSSYVGDAAADCSKSLEGSALSACLIRNGLASGATPISDQSADLSEAAKTTKPKSEIPRSIR